MTTLADDLGPDELWAIVEPLPPVPPRPRYRERGELDWSRAAADT